MKRRIEIESYNPIWPEKYKNEIILINKKLKSEIVRDFHIGSTSVAGLFAKPVIDILLEVLSVERLDYYNEDMTSIGYESKGAYGLPRRRFYMKGGDFRTHHIHAYSKGDIELTRHIAFRDYLRVYPEIALKYAEVKQKAAMKNLWDIQGYMKAKNNFIKEIEQVALSWYLKQTG